MARTLRFLSLSILALAFVAPASAQSVFTMKSTDSGACAGVACTATSPSRYCVQGTQLFICNTGTGLYTAVASAPGGSNLQVQYNSGGSAFAGDAGLTYAPGSGVLSVPAGINAPLTTQVGSVSLTNGGAISMLRVVADFTMADPSAAPTGGTSGGFAACTNSTGQSYRIAATCLNQSGETNLSPYLSFTTSGSAKQIQNITFPACPGLATHRRLYYAQNSETFGIWRACDVSNAGSGGTSVHPYFAISSTQGACNCGGGAGPPGANTTGAVTFLDARDGELRAINNPGTLPGDGSVSPVLTGQGQNRFYLRGSTMQASFDSGVTAQTILTDTVANLLSGTSLVLNGAGGNVKLVWDAASQQVQVFVGGAVKARVDSQGEAPGDCLLDVYGLTGGDQCYNPTTQQTWIRDDRGAHVVGQ